MKAVGHSKVRLRMPRINVALFRLPHAFILTGVHKNGINSLFFDNYL